MQQKATKRQNTKLAYSIKELSELTGISERKIYYEIEEGKLRIARFGRRVLILESEANRWLKEAEVT